MSDQDDQVLVQSAGGYDPMAGVARAIAFLRALKAQAPKMLAAHMTQVENPAVFHQAVLSIAMAAMLDLDRVGGDSDALLRNLIVKKSDGPPKPPGRPVDRHDRIADGYL